MVIYLQHAKLTQLMSERRDSPSRSWKSRELSILSKERPRGWPALQVPLPTRRGGAEPFSQLWKSTLSHFG